MANSTPAQIKAPNGPSRRPEALLGRKFGGGLIAGVDEVGRGPLAGPVVAAAVVFFGKPPAGIDDSKRLAAPVREALFLKIAKVAHFGIGIVSAAEIDEVNIYHATHQAMCAAVESLPIEPAAVLIDGNACPKALAVPAEPLVGGDGLSVSVAAASIMAKVTRDRLMIALSTAHPVYGFASNKGYATKEHLDALEVHGLCEHHRRSFRARADLTDW